MSNLLKQLNIIIFRAGVFLALIFSYFIGFSQTSYYVTEFRTRAFHPEIKQWDDYSEWQREEDPIASVIKFYSSGISMNVTINGQPIEYYGSYFDFDSDRSSGTDWNYYKGLAYKDNSKIGPLYLDIFSASYEKMQNGNSSDEVRMDVTINNYSELERQYGIGGALFHTSEQFEFDFRVISKDVYQTRMNEKKQLSENASKNLREGVDFLLLNKTKPGVKVLESGLQYKIITQTKGVKPTIEDSVNFHVTVSLINGVELENDSQRIGMKTLMAGLKQGISLMSKGSEYIFYVSPDLAFGSYGGGNLPPNSTLIIDVKLLNVYKDK